MREKRATVTQPQGSKRERRRRASCAALVAIALAGCGADDHAGDGGNAGTGPLYLVATRFEAGDQIETYLVTTGSFDSTTALDPTDGPKLLGGIVPVVHEGAVFVPDSNGPVLLRYDIGANGKLQKGAELSFAGVGLTEIASWHVWIVSDTKGYVFDPTGPRLVVWNPETMALSGKEIELAAIARSGWSANLVFEQSGPRARGDQLFVPLGWVDQDFNSRYASGVLVLDTRTDEVLEIGEDERCGETYTTIEAPGGDIYFFPPDWSSAPHFFADMHQPTCVLRVRAGETRFDPDYTMDLSALGSGSAAAGAVPDGGTGFFFVTADEALWEAREENGGTYWRFWHYDFSTEASREVDSMPDWAGHPYYVKVGGEVFIPYRREVSTGYRTTLYRLDGAGDPSPSFSFDASWMGMARLR